MSRFKHFSPLKSVRNISVVLSVLVICQFALCVTAADVGDEESVRMTVVVHKPIGGYEYSCFLSSPDTDATVYYARYRKTRSKRYTYSNYNYYNREPVGATSVSAELPGSIRVRLDSDYQNYFGIYYCQARQTDRLLTTITATVLLSNAEIVPADGRYTKTVNSGDVGVQIEMKKLVTDNTMLAWRFNNSDILQTSYSSIYAIRGPVTKNDAGVYECHFNGERYRARQGLVRLIVRGCPAGRWGPPTCYGICDHCYNGGICNDRNGRCECPAGFTGTNCLNPCGPNLAGFNCEITCSTRGMTCAGQVFCLPDPLGCTCATGFKGLRCDTECDPGTFGGNCLQDCHCLQTSQCDKVTGECIGTNNGCALGWSGDSCQFPDVCDVDYYGDNCTLKCQCMDGQPCNKETGQCSNGQCRAGFTTYSNRLYCEECPGGSYGLDCVGTCNCEETSCNKATGTCDGGCKLNWALPDCTTGVVSFYNTQANSGQESVFTCTVTGNTPPAPSSVKVHRSSTGTSLSPDTDRLEGSFLVLTFSISAVQLREEFTCRIEGISATLSHSADMFELPVLTRPPRPRDTQARDVTIEWDAWNPEAGDSGDPPITGYTVYYRRATAGSSVQWQKAQDVTLAVLSSTVSDLEPEADYEFGVSVTREGNGGEGRIGPILSVTTPCSEPLRPPGNIQASSLQGAPREISVSWEDLGVESHGCSTGITHYVIRYAPNTATYTFKDTQDGAVTNATLTNLEPYTRYGISIRAANGIGVGPWSDDVMIYSPEETAPTPSVTIPMSDTSSITVWALAATPHNLNGNVSHYILRYWQVTEGSQGDAVVKFINETGFKLVYTISDLDSMKDYSIQVQIVNGVGGSDWSDAVRATTIETGKKDIQSSSGGGIAAGIIVVLALLALVVGGIVLYRKGLLNIRRSKGSEVNGIGTGNKNNAYDNTIYENTVQGDTTDDGLVKDNPVTLTGDAVIYDNTDSHAAAVEPVAVQVKIHIPPKPTRKPPPPLSKGQQATTPGNPTTATTAQEELEEPISNYPLDDDSGLSSPEPTTDDQCQYGNVNLAPALSVPISVDKLEAYIKSKKASTTDNLKYEFLLLPNDKCQPWKVASHPDLKTRNRFKNIIPYDHSRVPLEPIDGVPLSHYYNASYVQDHKQKNSFIAAMGPNANSLRDFWRMVWQEEISVIAMLTQLVENNKDKCKRYWPTRDDQEERHGSIVVKLLNRESFSDYTISTLQVSQVGQDETPRTIKHFNFTSWPDMGVPLYPTSILNLVQVVKAAQTKKTGRHTTGANAPLLVHCSAGVGRTGTFIAIYTLLDKMAESGEVSVFGFVNQMRENRVNMVQTYDQYLFIYSALLEGHLCGDTRIPVGKFVDQLATLKKINPKTRKRYIEEEFQILNRVTPMPRKDAFGVALQPENAKKNRFADVLPLECNRPSLLSTGGSEDASYINAAFVDSFRHRDVFITTQMPLPNTVTDMWRLVYDWNCSTIVMMNDSYSPREELGEYLPESDTDFGPLSVEVLAETKGRIYNSRTLRVSKRNSEDECLTVKHFQLQGWANNENKPTSPLSILELYDAMQNWNLECESSSRTIVHCINGIGRSGVFCTVSTVFEKMAMEEIIDVFQAVKRLRMNRPQMIESLDQYILCYEVIAQHLERFKHYDNLD